jgi:hypothetical protein
MEKDGIKVDGYIGTWYVIDEKVYEGIGKVLLLEHETYGDSAACVIIREEDGFLLEEEVWNGFADFEERREM